MGDQVDPTSIVNGWKEGEQAGTDPLFPGEEAAVYGDDPEHWAAVYWELERMARELGQDRLAERFERRLRFWRTRMSRGLGAAP